MYFRLETSIKRPAYLLAIAIFLFLTAYSSLSRAETQTGWGANTDGGKGGTIVRVTNLNNEGEGSLKWALNQQGPRIVVFEVGGVIDLERSNLTVDEPNLTIAGQTAPSPGITLIRGGLSIRADDVIVQHLRIRPGDGHLNSGHWDTDALNTRAAKNVLVEHCSLSWGTDENLTAGGPRQEGASPEEWRAATSKNITFRNNIVAEGLLNATHKKGEHSKGILVHDNVEKVLIQGNLVASNYERSPLMKGGASAIVANNLIYNPGRRAIHYNLIAREWLGEKVRGHLSIVSNVLRAGPSTELPVPLFMIGGQGTLDFYMDDNIALDAIGQPLPETGSYGSANDLVNNVKHAPKELKKLSFLKANQVEGKVLETAGARHWDRDDHDIRVLADTSEGRGKMIDSQEEVGGYPKYEMTTRSFNPDDWDLATMTPKDEDTLYTSIWPVR